MRVGILTTSYPRFPGDPSGHFVQAEARHRQRLGDDVVVVAPGTTLDGGGEHDPEVYPLGGGSLFGPPGALERLRREPTRLLELAGFARRARNVLGRRSLDLVRAHWLLPCAWPIAHGLAPRIEAIAHGSDVRLLGSLPAPVRRCIGRALCRDVAQIQVVSGELGRLLVSLTFAEMARRVTVAASPIELPPLAAKNTLRKRLGVCDAERLAVVTARLVEDKRVEKALRAIAHLEHLRVVVLGAGPLLAPLAAAFPQVRFTGPLSRGRALEWIAAADVVVSASQLEGAPTAVREARALGVPVVATPAGDLRDWARQDPGLWLTGESATQELP